MGPSEKLTGWKTDHRFGQDLQSRLSLPQIPALHGIRAIAVLLVIFYHAGLGFPGGHGVLIFFVLSGFLITWLLLRENDKSGNISLSGFYRRRVLRIFPAFYFYWIFLVGLLLTQQKPVPWPHALSSFFYVSNYYDALFGDQRDGFSHTWSLAIEEQFYLLWPFLFVVFRKNLKRMTVFLAGLIGTVWVYRCILYLFNVDQAYFYASFDTRLDSLMVGCLLAVLLKRGALMTFWRAACSHSMAPLITTVIFASSIFLGPLFVTRYRDVVGFAIEPLLVAVVIVQLIVLSSTPPFKWIEGPVMRFLGEISYSLYLWQQLTLGVVRHLEWMPPAVRLMIAFAITLAVASFSFYVIERPFLKRRHQAHVPAKGAPKPAVHATAMKAG